MFQNLLPQLAQLYQWEWAQFEPYYQDLARRDLNNDQINAWLADWTSIAEVVDELFNRLMVAVSANTADTDAEKRYQHFFDAIYPKAMQAEDDLKRKFLAFVDNAGTVPAGMEIPVRNLRAETDLFREANLLLQSDENRLRTEYDKIMGAQTVTWEGEERTIAQMEPVYQDPDRDRRELAWRIVSERQLADRQAVNQVWAQLLANRLQQSANADRPDYRAYRWQELHRFDYTPADARAFLQNIEDVVVPAASRIYERRRLQLGVDALRPWDLQIEPSGLPALHPFDQVDDLKAGAARIFHQVDPQLGAYFDEMRQHDLLDLENRKNKAPGGYCTAFALTRRPFIFMNAVGTHDNVQTLLHEGGHAFHVFESRVQPYTQQLNVPMEFAEVASMGMELLAAPYLQKSAGGFYTKAEAARARIEHLEGGLCFWPYMAVVDAFQHWVYENPAAAAHADNCDACWADLWRRYMPGVDWSGFEDVMATGWHRKLHIHTVPFYYIEYGLAQLGAVQVWRNALQDQSAAVVNYRKALALGGTVSLPELYRTAGARFAFDAGILREAVTLMESTIEKLTPIANQPA